MQIEALRAIDDVRREGKRRAIVISATGTALSVNPITSGQDRAVVIKDDGEGDGGGTSVGPHVADGLAQMARELPSPRVPQRPPRGDGDGEVQA